MIAENATMPAIASALRQVNDINENATHQTSSMQLAFDELESAARRQDKIARRIRNTARFLDSEGVTTSNLSLRLAEERHEHCAEHIRLALEQLKSYSA